MRTEINFLNLRQQGGIHSYVGLSETQRSQVASPEAYAHFVTEDLPSEMDSLVLFAIGQSLAAEERFEEAINVSSGAILGFRDPGFSLLEGADTVVMSGLYLGLGQILQQDEQLADALRY